VPAGEVLDQHPGPGELIAADAEVSITLSAGPPTSTGAASKPPPAAPVPAAPAPASPPGRAKPDKSRGRH
jgi:beta-lactam-binding protein with PASTA domain